MTAKVSQTELKLSGLTGKLAGISMGSTTGNTIVAVHGWLDNAASFQPLADQLGQYRWHCLDMPGHGKSDPRPPGCIYHFTDYIGDLYRAMQSLEIESCDLVGHSLGAGICATFAAAFPEKVKRLVLIDGIGPISGDDDDSLMQLKKSMAHLTQASIEGPRHYPSWDRLIAKRLAAGKIQRHSVEILMGRGAERKGDGATVLSDRRLKQHSPIYMNQEKVLSILSGIEARSLLMLAKDGLVGKRKSTEQRIDAIKDLTVVEVEGAHHVHLDYPDVISAAIREFLG